VLLELLANPVKLVMLEILERKEQVAEMELKDYLGQQVLAETGDQLDKLEIPDHEESAVKQEHKVPPVDKDPQDQEDNLARMELMVHKDKRDLQDDQEIQDQLDHKEHQELLELQVHQDHKDDEVHQVTPETMDYQVTKVNQD